MISNAETQRKHRGCKTGLIHDSAGRGRVGGRHIICLLALAGFTTLIGFAQSRPPTEYQIKAVFLFNFTRFIEWPANWGRENQPICIGILGEDPFGSTLDNTIKGKTINGRGLTIKRSREFQDLRGCQILFVSSSEKRDLPKIFERLGNASMLTVGETNNFATSGGMINFVLEDEKVHFEINVDAAERAGLRVSSQLLKLAHLVSDKEKR
ncbi:MAG TPA: YfiR family protein [Bacteroidota bacterium]|jgi:hypothetical protein|nr:YfiR family protein [Bacteroidota bacterium]